MLNRTVFTAWLSLIGCYAVGQAYVPLLDTTAWWVDNIATYDLGPDYSDFGCTVSYVGQDTSANDTSFRKLLQRGFYAHNDLVHSEYSFTNWYADELFGFLREDTVARKVFMRFPDWWQDEFVLYDFAAVPGEYPMPMLQPDAVANAVTTVDINGPRRAIILNNDEWIIEGVGNTSGLFSDGYNYNTSFRKLVRHSRQGSVDFSQYALDSSCVNTTDISDHRASRIRIGPSPTSGPCHLEGAPPSARIRILSLQGQLVGSTTASPSGSAWLDLTALPASVYVIEICDALVPSRLRVVKE